MEISDYFKVTTGHGVLATANDKGRVNAAVYSRPFFTDEVTALFIMAEHLSHENLKTNPYATYLFMETNSPWTGKRLYLKKFKETKDPELVAKICRQCDYAHYEVGESSVAYFKVEEILPLLGGKS